MKHGLVVLFVLFFLLSAGNAQAQSLPVGDSPLAISRLHCRLLLHAAGDARALVGDLLGEVTGDPGLPGRLGALELQAMRRAGAELPDFGFVIGARWETATRNERRNFNYYFAQKLIREFGLAAPRDYRDTCLPDVTITMLPDDRLPHTYPGKRDFPRERSYEALANISLPGNLSLQYRLEKHPGFVWGIEELRIGDTSLAARYGKEYNLLLASAGFDGLIRHLAGEIAPKASSGSDTPQ